MSRIHLIGMPHNDPVRAVEWCAFAQKTRRLVSMLSELGHDVLYYGGPELEAPAAEHVVVASRSDRARWFGAETWADRVFDRWDRTDPCWADMNRAAIAAICPRIEPTDILALTMGSVQRAIAEAFPHHVKAEVGIGYVGAMRETHWCVESEAWRHYLYGRHGIDDGRFYDTVIPNSYDPDEFEPCADKDDYLLYLGRMTPRKGLEVVAELAKHQRVITAGQGDARVPGAEHRGVVTGDDKRKLLAGAKAVLAPSIYIEPFGGVTAEAMLSGTPVITTPWGAYSETVKQNLTGFLCHTRQDFLDAADRAHRLHPDLIRAYALTRFTTDVVAPQYDRWIGRLQGLYGRGWYG